MYMQVQEKLQDRQKKRQSLYRKGGRIAMARRRNKGNLHNADGEQIPEERRQSLRSSFGNAGHGILISLWEERNLKIHCFVAILVVVFGVMLNISKEEWIICFALFGLIMGLELVNTAVENVVDLVTDEWAELAGKAKDCAAGAVLIASFWAALAGGTIFFPKLYRFIVSLLW